MENATKALLIAASVLIVIILISVGIKLLSSVQGVAEQAGSVSESISASIFNSHFKPYFGESIPGSEAKNLVQKVIDNNTNSEHIINLNLYPAYLTHRTSKAHLQEIYNRISTSKSYRINPTKICSLSTGGYKDGFLACIEMYEN